MDNEANINFGNAKHKHWNYLQFGGAFIDTKNDHIRLGFKESSRTGYSNAQIDDYTLLKRKNYLWKSPTHMSLRARFRFSNNMDTFHGTAGFGFWNNPCSLNEGLHILPESVWFIYASSRSKMKLGNALTGYGWKSQIVHAWKWQNLLYFIPTAVSVLIAKFTGYTPLAYYWIQKFSGVEEILLDAYMQDWHTYEIRWAKDKTIFSIDGVEVFSTRCSPSKPLGFVAWVDNQYSIISPVGTIEFGTADSKGLILELEDIKISSL